MGDWEDEPITDLLKKKEHLKANWDDEDLDNVKESWEDEDDPATAPKVEPEPSENAPKKAAKSGHKKVKASEASKDDPKEEPLDPVQEKLLQQRLVEEADYKATTELFSKKGDDKTLDSFIPKTETDFSEYAELISHKLRPYEKLSLYWVIESCGKTVNDFFEGLRCQRSCIFH